MVGIRRGGNGKGLVRAARKGWRHRIPGYSAEQAEGQITALVVDGEPTDTAKKGDRVSLIANQSPFYGESGGQIGDTGVITVPDKGRVRVTDTQKKLGDMTVHVGTVEEGEIAVGDMASLAVNGTRRDAIRANHSATHLLHAALRRTLGEHVTQKGSLVAPERLRFDFSHPKALSADEIQRIEDEVNAAIRANVPVTTRLMDPGQRHQGRRHGPVRGEVRR